MLWRIPAPTNRPSGEAAEQGTEHGQGRGFESQIFLSNILPSTWQAKVIFHLKKNNKKNIFKGASDVSGSLQVGFLLPIQTVNELIKSTSSLSSSPTQRTTRTPLLNNKRCPRHDLLNQFPVPSKNKASVIHNSGDIEQKLYVNNKCQKPKTAGPERFANGVQFNAKEGTGIVYQYYPDICTVNLELQPAAG